MTQQISHYSDSDNSLSGLLCDCFDMIKTQEVDNSAEFQMNFKNKQILKLRITHSNSFPTTFKLTLSDIHNETIIKLLTGSTNNKDTGKDKSAASNDDSKESSDKDKAEEMDLEMNTDSHNI
eukprot:430765_1